MITHLRWDEIYEMAEGQRPMEPLTDEEWREYDGIKQTLRAIDASWQVNGISVDAETAKRLLTAEH